jgi:hypothetical protein
MKDMENAEKVLVCTSLMKYIYDVYPNLDQDVKGLKFDTLVGSDIRFEFTHQGPVVQPVRKPESAQEAFVIISGLFLMADILV